MGAIQHTDAFSIAPGFWQSVGSVAAVAIVRVATFTSTVASRSDGVLWTSGERQKEKDFASNKQTPKLLPSLRNTDTYRQTDRQTEDDRDRKGERVLRVCVRACVRACVRGGACVRACCACVSACERACLRAS